MHARPSSSNAAPRPSRRRRRRLHARRPRRGRSSTPRAPTCPRRSRRAGARLLEPFHAGYGRTARRRPCARHASATRRWRRAASLAGRAAAAARQALLRRVGQVLRQALDHVPELLAGRRKRGVSRGPPTARPHARRCVDALQRPSTTTSPLAAALWSASAAALSTFVAALRCRQGRPGASASRACRRPGPRCAAAARRARRRAADVHSDARCAPTPEPLFSLTRGLGEYCALACCARRAAALWLLFGSGARASRISS